MSAQARTQHEQHARTDESPAPGREEPDQSIETLRQQLMESDVRCQRLGAALIRSHSVLLFANRLAWNGEEVPGVAHLIEKQVDENLELFDDIARPPRRPRTR